MKEYQTPAGREPTIPELYGDGPIPISIHDIYTLPGMPYGKDTPEHFQPLLESVRKDGILKPVTLIPRLEGGYYLVDGYRRCHAAVRCRLAVIPSRVEAKTVQEVYREMLGRDSGFPPAYTRPRGILQHIREMFGLNRHRQRKQQRGRER